MLILTRRPGERVRLLLPDGREIWVGLAEVQGQRARLTFDAPLEVQIAREEVLGKRAREDKAS
jgi:carbon storage regulator CsrA